MRVEVEHKTTEKGLFNPVPFYEVWLYATFTSDELDIIYRANLYDFVIAPRELHPESIKDTPPEEVKVLKAEAPLKVRDLVEKHPEGWAFASFPAAKSYEADVEEGLKRIKQLIDSNRNPSFKRVIKL